MEIFIQDLSKQFGSVSAVQSLDLDIQDGEFVAFLHPSGCGKTTTLLMLAGIYKPSGGVISFGGRVMNQIPPRERNIGMVFQSYALYPHMTVFQNISYPLKLKNIPMKVQKETVQSVADTMGIGNLLDRRPAQLSGGQQQRVALGRALVKEPDVLLFDEPLSNLDARLRLTMRGEIKHLQSNLGITSVYVTHDQVEALSMADRIAVMNNGKLEAYDTPEDLYDHPRTVFIAGFVGNPPMNFLDVQVAANGEDYVARNDDIEIPVAESRARAAMETRDVVTLGIRPEDVSIDDEGTISGEVFIVEPLGRDDMLDVRVEDHRIIALADPRLKVKPGDNVKLTLNPNKVQFFDRATEQSLLWSK
ncbi:MAG: ABC transporter ATP-binding protein [Chloroflexota bacterium]